MIGQPLGVDGDQQTALSQLQSIAESGEADVDRMQRLEIEDYMAGTQARGQEDILRDLARRGQAGGGDVLRARLGANQAASQSASQIGRGAIADRAGRRLDAIRESGLQAGEMSGQEIQRGASNQRAETAYNQLFANLNTDAARFGAFCLDPPNRFPRSVRSNARPPTRALPR